MTFMMDQGQNIIGNDKAVKFTGLVGNWHLQGLTEGQKTGSWSKKRNWELI